MTSNSANAEIILQVLSSLQHLMPRLWGSLQPSKTLTVCSQTMCEGGYTRNIFAKPSEEGSCTDFFLCSQPVLSPKHIPQEHWKCFPLQWAPLADVSAKVMQGHVLEEELQLPCRGNTDLRVIPLPVLLEGHQCY